MCADNSDLFCFFSGFAHQDIRMLESNADPEQALMVLTCQNNGEHPLTDGDYIQLDGVLFQIIEIGDFYFKASSTFELIKDTSIINAKPGDKLSLGVLAEKDISHDCLWMLQPSARGQVTYRGYSVLEGHQHTLQLNFETPAENLHSLTLCDGQHVGLAGSSLTAQCISSSENLVQFSIFCGRETRENSQFNQDLQPGTAVNLTEPAAIIQKKFQP